MPRLNAENDTAYQGKHLMETTLDQLAAGEQGILQQYSGDGDLQGRLKELGLVRGTMILVERYAPLGDPLEIKVRGYHLAIRKKDAAQIVVRRLPSEAIQS